MPLSIRILPRAENDIDHILDWMINQRESPQGAKAWYAALSSAIQSIAIHPESYPFVPEKNKLGRDVRQSLFKTRRGRTYRCIFILSENEVHILRVRGPGQPPLSQDEI